MIKQEILQKLRKERKIAKLFSNHPFEKVTGISGLMIILGNV